MTFTATLPGSGATAGTTSSSPGSCAAAVLEICAMPHSYIGQCRHSDCHCASDANVGAVADEQRYGRSDSEHQSAIVGSRCRKQFREHQRARNGLQRQRKPQHEYRSCRKYRDIPGYGFPAAYLHQQHCAVLFSWTAYNRGALRLFNAVGHDHEQQSSEFDAHYFHRGSADTHHLTAPDRTSSVRGHPARRRVYIARPWLRWSEPAKRKRLSHGADPGHGGALDDRAASGLRGQ